MLILERAVEWYQWNGGYLNLAGAVGWIMCAVLAATFRPTPHVTDAAPPLAALWRALAAAFALLAAAALAAVLERNGRTGPGNVDLATFGATVTALGAALLLGCAPLAGTLREWGLCRASLILTALVPLILEYTAPALRSWSAVIIHGGGGGWLLLRGAPRGRPADPAIPAGRVSRILGGALLTLGAGAAAELVAPHTVASALVVALGACGTGGAWWWLYLRERTVPRVRDRRGPWGARASWLLPGLQLVVLVGGGVAQHAVVQHTEQRAAQRLVDELRTVLSALNFAHAPPSPGASAQASLRPADLPALLAASPAYRSCALTTAGPPDAGTAGAVDALRLRPGREQQAARAGCNVLRWASPTRATDLVVIFLPLGDAGHGPEAPLLAVAVEAGGLADIIVSHRLQMLVIVALTTLVAGVAVLASVRARNETELRLLKERAELESGVRHELLAMVSHEVRTPLQSVLGYAELAAMDALPPAAERHVRAIRGQGAALLRIVQDILDLSALHHGRLELRPEAVALTALAAEVRRALAERARRKGLELTITVDETAPPVVLVDRVRLVQVLLNLVGNAIKFTAQGRVRLVVSRLTPGADPAQARLEFRVEDTGPGIPEPQLRRVFEPFHKASDDVSNSGVGLGLAICDQIVTSLRGRITVESRVGHGTTFRVELTLPTAPALPATAPAGPAGDGGEMDADALAGLRVLLIDDHPFVRDLLRDSLQRLGAHVTACADGVTGLAAAAHARPDVVLLDLKLPDRSPEQMLAGLRAPPTPPDDPWIVGLSAGATEAEIQQVLGRGMNDFLLKPVSISGLAETLRLSPAGAKIRAAPREGGAARVNPRAATADERATLLTEAAPAIVRIAHACHVGDTDRAAAEAHFLANSCLMLGLTAAHRICRTIEEAAEQSDFAAAREALGALREEIAEAHAAESRAAG